MKMIAHYCTQSFAIMDLKEYKILYFRKISKLVRMKTNEKEVTQDGKTEKPAAGFIAGKIS